MYIYVFLFRTNPIHGKYMYMSHAFKVGQIPILASKNSRQQKPLMHDMCIMLESHTHVDNSIIASNLNSKFLCTMHVSVAFNCSVHLT